MAASTTSNHQLNGRHTNHYNSNCGEDVVIVDATAAASDDDRNDRNVIGTGRQVGGAAVIGGLVGLCLAGPIIGLVAAGGAAAVATSKCKAGDVARSTGTVASDAGDRLQQFNQKHRIVEKTSNGIIKGCRWMSHQLKQSPTKDDSPSRPT
jgi:hypothetical protein